MPGYLVDMQHSVISRDPHMKTGQMNIYTVCYTGVLYTSIVMCYTGVLHVFSVIYCCLSCYTCVGLILMC